MATAAAKPIRSPPVQRGPPQRPPTEHSAAGPHCAARLRRAPARCRRGSGGAELPALGAPGPAPPPRNRRRPAARHPRGAPTEGRRDRRHPRPGWPPLPPPGPVPPYAPVPVAVPEAAAARGPLDPTRARRAGGGGRQQQQALRRGGSGGSGGGAPRARLGVPAGRLLAHGHGGEERGATGQPAGGQRQGAAERHGAGGGRVPRSHAPPAPRRAAPPRTERRVGQHSPARRGTAAPSALCRAGRSCPVQPTSAAQQLCPHGSEETACVGRRKRRSLSVEHGVLLNNGIWVPQHRTSLHSVPCFNHRFLCAGFLLLSGSRRKTNDHFCCPIDRLLTCDLVGISPFGPTPEIPPTKQLNGGFPDRPKAHPCTDTSSIAVTAAEPQQPHAVLSQSGSPAAQSSSVPPLLAPRSCSSLCTQC